jgi:hypothetical protein
MLKLGEKEKENVCGHDSGRYGVFIDAQCLAGLAEELLGPFTRNISPGTRE